MCVLNGSQVYWTIEVQDAFAGLKDDPDCIKDASEMLQKQVPDLVALVRTLFGFYNISYYFISQDVRAVD